MTDYGQRTALTRNFRSVPSVVALANALASRVDTADRPKPEESNGAFFIGYKKADRDKLLVAFQAAVAAAGLCVDKSAVVCRASATAAALVGADASIGQGLVKQFARAALLRDQHRDFSGAFKVVAGYIAGLLKKPGDGWLASVTQATRHPEMKPVRRIIWSFTRDPGTGLPASTLVADTQWQPQLLANIRALMARLQEDHGLEPVPNLGSRLAKTELTNAPLHAGADLATGPHANLRIHTVHKVKGETLDAVLYLAEKDHAETLLRGAETELGRIGYVAVTRARNLVWLGVPTTALDALRPALVARGFSEVGVA